MCVLRLERSVRKDEEVEEMVEPGTIDSLSIVARRPRWSVDVKRVWRAAWSSRDAGWNVREVVVG